MRAAEGHRQLFVLTRGSIGLILALIVTLPSPARATSCATLATLLGPDEVDAALEDSSGAGEAVPRGLRPEIGWARKGRLNMGNDPGTFGSILPWGQVFAAPENRSESEWVQIRGVRLFMLSRKDGRWRRMMTTNAVTGALYLLNYDNDEHVEATESSAEGGTTALARADRSYHFWPTLGRLPIRKDDVAGVFVSMEGRIAPRRGGSTPDRQSHYLMSVGADYWLDQTAQWDEFKTNNDVGIGRFKRLGASWRRFYMTSADRGAFDRCVQPDAP